MGQVFGFSTITSGYPFNCLLFLFTNGSTRIDLLVVFPRLHVQDAWVEFSRRLHA